MSKRQRYPTTHKTHGFNSDFFFWQHFNTLILSSQIATGWLRRGSQCLSDNTHMKHSSKYGFAPTECMIHPASCIRSHCFWHHFRLTPRQNNNESRLLCFKRAGSVSDGYLPGPLDDQVARSNQPVSALPAKMTIPAADASGSWIATCVQEAQNTKTPAKQGLCGLRFRRNAPF